MATVTDYVILIGMTTTRLSLLDALIKNAQTWSFCLAAWEGGAASNNRVDQFSDLDLVFCVEDDAVEESFRRVDSVLGAIGKIEHRYRVPEPTWNGHSQCYYRMAGMPDYFFVDAVVVKKSSANKPLEKERHGLPVVHFDKTGIVKPVSADTDEFRKRVRDRIEAIESSFPIYKSIVIKELLRKRALDSLAFYRILVGFYVELLGVKHRPFHYDFGLRYAHIEFPLEVQNEISSFSYVVDIDDVRGKLEPLSAKIEDLLTRIRQPD